MSFSSLPLVKSCKISVFCATTIERLIRPTSTSKTGPRLFRVAPTPLSQCSSPPPVFLYNRCTEKSGVSRARTCTPALPLLDVNWATVGEWYVYCMIIFYSSTFSGFWQNSLLFIFYAGTPYLYRLSVYLLNSIVGRSYYWLKHCCSLRQKGLYKITNILSNPDRSGAILLVKHFPSRLPQDLGVS